LNAQPASTTSADAKVTPPATLGATFTSRRATAAPECMATGLRTGGRACSTTITSYPF